MNITWKRMSIEKQIKSILARKLHINLSDEAITYIDSCLKIRGKGLGIRLAIKDSECSGLSYEISYVDRKKDNDVVFNYKNFDVFIDPKSILYLNGADLAATEKGLNLSVDGGCSCGESFII